MNLSECDLTSEILKVCDGSGRLDRFRGE
jgi:hypothetical protein